MLSPLCCCRGWGLVLLLYTVRTTTIRKGGRTGRSSLLPSRGQNVEDRTINRGENDTLSRTNIDAATITILSRPTTVGCLLSRLPIKAVIPTTDHKVHDIRIDPRYKSSSSYVLCMSCATIEVACLAKIFSETELFERGASEKKVYLYHSTAPIVPPPPHCSIFVLF